MAEFDPFSARAATRNPVASYKSLKYTPVLPGVFVKEKLTVDAAVNVGEFAFSKNQTLLVIDIYDAVVSLPDALGAEAKDKEKDKDKYPGGVDFMPREPPTVKTKVPSTTGPRGNSRATRHVVLRDIVSRQEMDIVWTPELAQYFVPCFGRTTHKMQGNEVPVVIYVLDKNCSRAQVYTALSRAQTRFVCYARLDEEVSLLDEEEADRRAWHLFCTACKKDELPRHTALSVALQDK